MRAWGEREEGNIKDLRGGYKCFEFLLRWGVVSDAVRKTVKVRALILELTRRGKVIKSLSRK